jgi:hypothetical protein
MTVPWRQFGPARRWFLALAALALALQVAVPQGFMLGAGQGASGLVICTGHGPLFSAGVPDRPAKAPKQTSGLCAFAVHAAAGGPSSLALISGPRIEAARAEPIVFVAAAPGRGLAAPPPPSRGPPRLFL